MNEPEKEPIPGTWDALEDAAEHLNRSGLYYVLTVCMEGSKWARTRTNMENLEGLEWIEARNAENLQKLRRDYE
jgi:hypothetical protein